MANYTNTDDIIIDAPTYELIDAGEHRLEVTDVERATAPVYSKTGAPTGDTEPAVRIRFRVVGGDWDGFTELSYRASIAPGKNLADPRASLNKIWTACTGTPIQAGQQLPIRATLVGKQCFGMIQHDVKEKGTYANITAFRKIEASTGPKRRIQQPVAKPVVVDADGDPIDDDLADA